jgi:hypothetical protein
MTEGKRGLYFILYKRRDRLEWKDEHRFFSLAMVLIILRANSTTFEQCLMGSDPGRAQGRGSTMMAFFVKMKMKMMMVERRR